MRGRSLHAYQGLHPEGSEKQPHGSAEDRDIADGPPTTTTKTTTNTTTTSTTNLRIPPDVYLPSDQPHGRRSSARHHAAMTPAATPPRSPSSRSPDLRHSHLHPASHPPSPRTSTHRPSVHSHVDSPRRSHVSRGSRPERPTGSPHTSRNSSRDLEKGPFEQRSPPLSQHSLANSAHHTTVFYTDPDEKDAGDEQDAHALWILFYLSTLVPFFALLTSLYSLLATFLLLLSSPVAHFLTRTSLRQHFHFFLARPLLLHLRLIYSHADTEDPDVAASPAASSPAMLVLINVLAPFYAIWITLAAWVAAGFWLQGALLGDPNGKREEGKEDEDERAVVLYVSGWWEGWLVRGLR